MGTVHTADNTRQRRRSRPHGMLALKKWPNALQGNGEIDPADLVRYKRRTAADKRHFQKELALYKREKCQERESLRVALEASVSQETDNAYFALHRAV
jgi:hypothetical protein